MGIAGTMPLVPENERERFTDLGSYIRGLREAKGWTQIQLAKKAKMRNERISEVENGSNARAEQYQKIAVALGYRGVLEMIMSGGDGLTVKLLRLWKRLPDDGARKDALQSMRDQIVADAERDAT